MSYAQAKAKRRRTPSRVDAGVAANATAPIVSTLRLLTQEDPAPPAATHSVPEIPF